MVLIASIWISGVLGFGLQAQAVSYNWMIETFDVSVEVRESGQILVTERIGVDFKGEKHGIYREIPTSYADAYGNKKTVKLELLNVRQDGGPAMYEFSRARGEAKIKIGDANLLISGQHVYEIEYQVDRVILFEDGFDEVYWNATGTDWDVPIVRSTAVVHVPEGAEILQQACYTGIFGSQASDCEVVENGGSVAFAATGPLTVAVGFTKGVVPEPTWWEMILWFLMDNWLAFLPVPFVILTALYWKKHGDDGEHGTVVAEYEPPQGVWAVYAGSLVKSGMFKNRYYTAMIVQLAVEGFIEIRIEDDEGKLKKAKITLVKKKEWAHLDKAHRALVDAFFEGKSEVVLREIKGKIPGEKIAKISKFVQEWLVHGGYFEKGSFKRRVGFIVGAWVFGMVGFAFNMAFGLFVAGSWFACAVIVGMFGWFMGRATVKGLEMQRKVKGFKLFMHTAERYRSEWHEKERMFAKYLPYAIAFDLVDEWAHAFEGVEQIEPEWYVGHRFSPAFFAAAMPAMTSSVGSAKVPSSSSGGGGSSGGGFGGGGGGSW